MVTYVILGVKQHFSSFRCDHVLFNPLVKGQTRVLLKHVGAYAHLLICTEKHMQAPDTTIMDHETLNEWLRVEVPLAAHHMLITTTPWRMCWQETPRTVAAECLKASVCLRQLRRVENSQLCRHSVKLCFLCDTMNVWEVCDLSPTCTIHCVATHKTHTVLGRIREVGVRECCNPQQVKTPLAKDVPLIQANWTLNNLCESSRMMTQTHKKVLIIA